MFSTMNSWDRVGEQSMWDFKGNINWHIIYTKNIVYLTIVIEPDLA